MLFYLLTIRNKSLPSFSQFNNKLKLRKMNTSTTIVAFHLGRGGRFHNAGHLSFIGYNYISKYVNNLYLSHENISLFKNMPGYDTPNTDGIKCILDLITDEEYSTLEQAYGITEDTLGVLHYYTECGNPVGLTKDEAESGIGRIDIDGGYDTTYTCYLHDCTEAEAHLIRRSRDYEMMDEDDQSIIKDIIGEMED